MGRSRITYLRGDHWWILKTRPSGRVVYPREIKVGNLGRERVYEHVAKAKLSAAVDGGWYCGRCAVFIGARCMANATEWIKPRRCPNCGAAFEEVSR